MSKNVIVLFIALLCVGFVQADILLDANFDSAVASGTQLTNVMWTQDTALIGTVTASSTIDSYETHDLRNDLVHWIDNVAVDYNMNLDVSTDRGIVSSFIAVEDIPLSELVIGHAHTSSSGTFQSGNSDMTVTITNTTDSIEVYTDTTNYSYVSVTGPWQSHTYDVSLVMLQAGKDYTITLTMNNLSDVGGAYASWNQITLTVQTVNVTGEPIVEEEGPTSDTFDIVLGSEPNDVVIITMTDPNDQVILDPNVVTFDSDNWDIARGVDVTAVVDGVLEEPKHSTEILFSVSSADDFYSGITIDPLTVEVMESHSCGLWGHLPADINMDCKVDLLDFGKLVSQWLGCTNRDGPECIDATLL